MDIKKTTPLEIIPRDLAHLEAITGNIYKSIVIMAKRANQISARQKDDIQEKISELAAPVDSLEELYENEEQIAMSIEYERQPKPVIQAAEEFTREETYFRDPEPLEADLEA